jgi:GrpB-like predicted nucleotidyltransferase (UPF0157 family)/ubiquinone/menaquinone biosynthesis C-methylase UbiE
LQRKFLEFFGWIVRDSSHSFIAKGHVRYDPTSMNHPYPGPREVVRRGYDRIGHRYLRWRRSDPATEWALSRALRNFPARGAALDLGCGAGEPVTRALTEGGFVTGVDLSANQLSLAQRRAPEAALIQADITEASFRPRSLNLVVAFYCLNHVPRQRLGVLLRRIETWLKQDGVFIASFGAGDDPGTIEDNWLGAPMFFSGFAIENTLSLLQQAGLQVLEQKEIAQEEHGKTATFLWVICSRGEARIVLADHRPEWSDVFAGHRRTLARIYGTRATAIEHVGSTAIPGIAAKPIVDIVVGLTILSAKSLGVRDMEEAGYAYYGERGLPGRELFASRFPHTVHVHVVKHDGDRWNRYIGFRDFFRANPEQARAYEELKKRLARHHASDRAAYTDGKTEFIEAALAKSAG